MDLLSKPTNNAGTNLPKDPRWKPMPLYCKGTGATCFLGPGSYNDMESFNNLNRAVCKTKIVSFVQLKNCRKNLAL